jgi:hypothetical protein
MRWHNDSGVGVVVLANSTYANAPRLASRILTALLDDLATPNVARARADAPSTPLTAPVLPPRSGALWPETVAAQADVESLVWSWDDDLAKRLLAMNVDLDEAMERRSAQLGFFRRVLGPFTRDDASEATSEAPSHLKWWMRGPTGRLQIEIRLSPELPPRVQTLSFTGVPKAPAAVRTAAEAIVVAMVADDVRWPESVAVDAAFDTADLTRKLRMAVGWAGVVELGDELNGGGKIDASFLLKGSRTLPVDIPGTTGATAMLVLALTVDADSGALTRFVIRPA